MLSLSAKRLGRFRARKDRKLRFILLFAASPHSEIAKRVIQRITVGARNVVPFG